MPPTEGASRAEIIGAMRSMQHSLRKENSVDKLISENEHLDERCKGLEAEVQRLANVEVALADARRRLYQAHGSRQGSRKGLNIETVLSSHLDKCSALLEHSTAITTSSSRVGARRSRPSPLQRARMAAASSLSPERTQLEAVQCEDASPARLGVRRLGLHAEHKSSAGWLTGVMNRSNR